MHLGAFICKINMDVCSISSCHSECRLLFESRADMTDRYVTVLNGKESWNSHSMIYVIQDLYSLEWENRILRFDRNMLMKLRLLWFLWQQKMTLPSNKDKTHFWECIKRVAISKRCKGKIKVNKLLFFKCYMYVFVGIEI